MTPLKTLGIVVLASLFGLTLGAGAFQVWAATSDGSKELDMSAEEQLRAQMMERRAASLDGDTEKVASSLTDDYLQTDVSGHLQDKATWLREYFIPLAALIKAGKFRWEVYAYKDLTFRMYGNSAFVVGALELRGVGAKIDAATHTWKADPNGSFGGTLRFTHLYVRRDDKWLLAVLHNSGPFPENLK